MKQPSVLPWNMEAMIWWILDEDGRTPKPVPMLEGLAWVQERGTVVVAWHETRSAVVRTVFTPRLTMPGNKPSLFETRVVPKSAAQAEEEGAHRWRSWAEALAGHEAVLSGLPPSLRGLAH